MSDDDVLIALDHLAEAEHSERLADLPYVVLELPLHAGLDGTYLL